MGGSNLTRMRQGIPRMWYLGKRERKRGRFYRKRIHGSESLKGVSGLVQIGQPLP
jgi:hypothetical protein